MSCTASYVSVSSPGSSAAGGSASNCTYSTALKMNATGSPALRGDVRKCFVGSVFIPPSGMAQMRLPPLGSTLEGRAEYGRDISTRPLMTVGKRKDGACFWTDSAVGRS